MPPTVCIGIPVHAQPDRLMATLAALRATAPAAALLLLPDGPDQATAAVLANLPALPARATVAPCGAAACFNRLAAYSDAAVIVLLESGAVPGPGWLECLLAALAADPRNGLAGPSTNRAWNEQAAFPEAGGSPAAVAATAAEAARRFGAATASLEPLHSLADFCYAVRREVIAAVGAADEGYGAGPCWEMDYNIRAARAGFRGVWAQGAYVYRAPFTPRRRRDEALAFEASRRRYQDKFCALRLRGEATGYEPHCRGEACEHFAPAGLIELRLPLPVLARPAPGAPPPPLSASEPAPRAPALCQLECDNPHSYYRQSALERHTPQSTIQNPHSKMVLHAPAPQITPMGEPLVSCIMPTGGRAEFALQAVRLFQRQDYPARELIILDDGADGLQARLPADARLRYVRVSPGQSIGAKRNRACELARGELVIHWDDDDWYAPDRLSRQAAPLLSGVAAISALEAGIFFDLPGWAFWSCTPALRRRLFVEDVHGGTLAFRRDVWLRSARYPDRSLAEDTIFLRQAMRGGARLARLPNQGSFVYVRHSANSWAFACGQHLDRDGWLPAGEPPLPVEDRAFYAARSPAAPPVAAPVGPREPPLVSCIMPTAGRRPFVPLALAYFQRQDYPRTELVVVDDGDDPVEDLMPADPRVRYLRLPPRRSVGAKRNLACEAARGELILHWDDDDWMSPARISFQAGRLLAAGAAIGGLRSLRFLDLTTRRAWRYTYPVGGRPWVAGNTLCYTREVWRQTPFHDIDNGEDTRFVWGDPRRRVLALDDDSFFVAIVHGRNVSPRRYQQSRWKQWPLAEVRAQLGDDWGFYAARSRVSQPA
jgi:O-antigen biosynthesis protein